MSDSPLLDAILAPGALSVLFQPIFDVSSDGVRLHAVESLTRGPCGTNAERTDVLFDYIRRKREEPRVDRACVTAALDAARQLPGHLRLGVNVHASTLGRDPEFVVFFADAAESRGFKLSDLILEIVEHAPYWDGPAFLNALDGLRQIGVAIALDDVGLGQSNYRMILDCRPNYFKVDRYLVHGAHADFYRQAVLESVSRLAEKFGARVVAEGVEDEADLAEMTQLGIRLIQGHWFSPAVPASAIAEAATRGGDRWRRWHSEVHPQPAHVKDIRLVTTGSTTS